MSTYFLSPESIIAGVDGSLFELSNEAGSKRLTFGKLVKDIAAIARISRRNASVGGLFAAHLSIEA